VESESIVYGCIRDWSAEDPDASRLQRASNQQVLRNLPAGEDWPFLGRQMFSCCEQPGAGLFETQVIHFGASYQSLEYEWNLWVKEFEALLKQLYWATAVVHLETEMRGLHTFRWTSENGLHRPSEDELLLRCSWEREGSLRG
jgi:hypothetical protein